VAAAPLPDTPYTEVISNRFVCADGGDSVVGWGAAPFGSAPDHVAATVNPGPGFVVLANGTGWTLDLPVTRSAATPGMTSNNSVQWLYPAVWTELAGVALGPGDALGVDPTHAYPGSIAAAAHADGSVDQLSCAGAVCKVLATYTYAGGAFGPVTAVGVTWQGGANGVPALWIGCAAGLVYMGPTGAFTLLLDARSVDVDTGITAVAISATTPAVAVGNGYHLWCVGGVCVCAGACLRTCHLLVDVDVGCDSLAARTLRLALCVVCICVYMCVSAFVCACVAGGWQGVPAGAADPEPDLGVRSRPPPPLACHQHPTP
jgi:hypothetical protein